MQDVTRKFAALDSKAEMKEILNSVYNSLLVKGYNPINQIVGYILSEDPTYITSYNNARSLITRLDRDELLQELLKNISKILKRLQTVGFGCFCYRQKKCWGARAHI